MKITRNMMWILNFDSFWCRFSPLSLVDGTFCFFRDIFLWPQQRKNNTNGSRGNCVAGGQSLLAINGGTTNPSIARGEKSHKIWPEVNGHIHVAIWPYFGVVWWQRVLKHKKVTKICIENHTWWPQKKLWKISQCNLWVQIFF